MGLFKRGDSPFHWMHLEPTGKRESTGIPIDGGTVAQTKANAELAQAVYAARMGDLAREKYDLPIARETISFAAFATWYADNVSVTKGGEGKERSMLRQLTRYFQKFYLHQVTMQDGIEWRRRRAEEVAASTVNREMDVLKHLLKSAVPKYLKANPIAGLGDLEADEVDIRIFTAAEEQALLEACRQDPEDYAIILTALDTLQRLTSCAKLEWTHVKAPQIVFLNAKVQAKLKRGNWIDMSVRLAPAVEAIPRRGRFLFEKFQRWKTDPRTGLQVPNVTARQNAVMRMFLQRCKQAGIVTGRAQAGVTFHCLRHTGATIMLQNGADPKTVMEIGGWKRIEQLQQYVHASRETKRAAVELIGARARLTRSA